MRAAIGPYRVERPIGEGGMGVVYAAYDERLQRQVAVKMLRADAAEGRGPERLWREARAAAAVSHPNVCQIYDVGEADGEIYVAMELLDGESLLARLARGPLDRAEASAAMLRVLDALDAIHQRGLIHRDLKPSNVFLTPHGVKLVDFGLAIPTQALANDATRVTMEGTIVGTPHYMSPEQIRGEPLDARADVFAAGAVFFEMLTGRPPFDAVTPMEVLGAILNREPPTSDLVAGPAQAIISRALAKQREDRYESARAMADAVGALSTGPWRAASATAPASPKPTRLIVLPFRLLRPDPEIDFLEFSLADAITTSLGGLRSLVVRSTLAAARFAHQTPLDLAAIAREADVDVVLAGTLLRAGTRVRASTQLLEVPDGTVVWSDQAQIALDDIFQFQDDLAARIVSSLELPLTAREHRLMHQEVPSSARAYEWYLRAVQLGARPTTWIQARDLLERCVAEDGQYAPGWARLGRIYRVLAKFGDAVNAGDYGQAEAAFQRALAISPELGLAHAGYAALEVDLGRATDAMSRLLTLAHRQATDPSIFTALVLACRYCGLLDASIAAHQRAKILDPRVQTSVAHTYLSLGNYRRGLDESGEPLDLVRALLLALCGRIDEALEAADLERRQAHGTEILFARFFKTTALGHIDEARTAVREILSLNFQDPEGIFYFGLGMSRLGDLAMAGNLLAQAVSGGYSNPVALTSQTWLAPMHGLDAFDALVQTARAKHQEAVAIYAGAGGPAVLGVPARAQA
jgi:serine/threonine protein kinase/tetratricopeptide (TPR) repeat protein